MPAPWDAVPPDEQLFVLVTGANSGIGLATCERLIDEFLTTRPLTAHLILLPTTRSASKALDTIAHLRAYTSRVAHSSSVLKQRATTNTSRNTSSHAPYDPQTVIARVHILSPQLDLCDVRGIKDLADRLCGGEVGNPRGLEGEYLERVRLPRLDAVLCNAGFGGWTGFSFPGALLQFATQGISRSVTWPNFKIPMPTRLLNDQPGYDYPAKPLLGEVFCACVFGHYLLIHALLPLLCRPADSSIPPARVIWSSSVEAAFLQPGDLQALSNPVAYESAKRVTDVLSLTCSLPSSKPYSRTWLTPDDSNVAREKPVRPKVYLTHPGIVASTFFPVPWFLMWAYRMVLVVARWLGSPWHNSNSYAGSKSAGWLILEPQPSLDAAEAERVKWGSALDRRLREGVKRTEVAGWGWEGRPVDDEAIRADTAEGVLHRSVGRHYGARETTDRDIEAFEELGKGVWEEMEDLRAVWEEIAEERGMLEQQINGKHSVNGKH